LAKKNVVTMHGNPLTLAGKEVEIGQKATDFEVLDNELEPVKLSSFRGKYCILCSVPSLDTPVCDAETRKFNEKAAGIDKDTVIVTISMDLPFAQKRWCGAAGVKNVLILSDHQDASFGRAFGVLIKELRLLARAVFIVDKESIVRYKQLVREITSEPDYDDVFKALKEITG